MIEQYDYSSFANETYQLKLSCMSEMYSGALFSTILFRVFVCIIYGVVFILSIFGNSLVCYVVLTTPEMKSVTNYFIVNLAVGDILMATFCVPFTSLSTFVIYYWPFGVVLCKVVAYFQAVSVLVSSYTLIAISIDRYIVIMRPLKPRVEKAAVKMVVAIVWCGAMITAAPIAVVANLNRSSLHHECDVDYCVEQWSNPKLSEYYTYALLTLQFGLPLCSLVCTYARIARLVWNRRTPGEANCERDTRIEQSKRKMIKMMVTVVVIFTICWLPLNIYVVLWIIHEGDEEWTSWPGLPYVWFVSHLLAMSHSCCNPIVYCYMNNWYRRGFQQVLGCLSRNQNTARSRHLVAVYGELSLSEASVASKVVRTRL